MNSKYSLPLTRAVTAVSMAGFIGLVYLGAFRLTTAEWWEWVGCLVLWLGPVVVLLRQTRE